MKRILAVALMLPELALAHSGHAGAGGSFLAGVGHPLGGLDHLLAMLAVGLWAARGPTTGRWALPLSFLAAMSAGALLGFAGFALPLIEAGILASLVGIGLILALALRPGISTSAALVALFGAFHGQAHGLEAPDHGALGYALGFLLATGALHLAGLALGRLPLARWLGAGTALAGLTLAMV